MSDVFGREVNIGGVYKTDKAIMSLGADLDSMLVTNVQAQYQQPVTRVVALNGAKDKEIPAYYIVGTPQGQGTIQQIIGPKPIMAAAYSRLANPCGGQDDTNNLTFTYRTTPCKGEQQDSKRTMKYVIATGLSMGVASQDMMIQESISVQFGSLELGEGTASK